MAACSFDMLFTYVNIGWEGSAADSRVLTETMRDPDDPFLAPPPHKYYVVDSGYSNTQCFLASIRGQRYHIQQFRNGGQPTGPQELFNYYHSSLRNCIERCFGVLKAMFKILRHMTNYWMPRQNVIPIACCVIHNLIKMQVRDDSLFRQYEVDLPVEDIEREQEGQQEQQHGMDVQEAETSEIGGWQQRNYMVNFRDHLANQMWDSYRRQ
ncbi:uncharacterized protein LOC112092955 [Morus notabilis]|uniref:uncharacterized protein LOC112092955 n=1 Tax=Morus notabilis TaxID=981085 RepID=UPI000CED33FC|nr:uncharacterized protein LOC112092955 [Morus notabilis]